MSRPKRSRQQAQGEDEAAVVPAPTRRTGRGASEDAAVVEQQQAQQPEQSLPVGTTRRSQQKQQQNGTAAEASDRPATRRSSRQQQQQQALGHVEDHHHHHHQQQQQQPGQLHEGDMQAAAAAAVAADIGPLDDFSKDSGLVQAVEALSTAAADPASFLQPNTHIAQAARQAAKALLQYTVTSITQARQPEQQQQQQSSLADQQQQLYVSDGFDGEQVWLQLDMQLAPLRKRLKRLVGQLADEGAAGAPQLVTPEVEAGLDAVLGQDDDSQREGGSDDSDADDDMADGQGDMSGLDDEDMAGGDEERGDDEQQQQQQQRGSKAVKQKKQLLPVEDRFMRLDEMEAFVAQAEREAAGLDEDDNDEDDGDLGSDDEQLAGNGLAGSDLGSDDDADLQDLLTSSAALVGKNIAKQQQQQQKASKQCKRGAAGGSGDEDLGLGDSDIEGLRSEDDEGDDVDAGDIMYKDFFGGGGSQQQAESEADSDDDDDADADGLDSDAAEGNDDRQQQQQKGKKAAAAADSKKGIHWYDDADDDDVELSDGEDEQEEEAPLSTHEKRLLRMQERIAELETEALGERPWHLVGEVSAARRPVNSALEIDMDYDTTNKPPPAPTEEATHSLEDMIRRRIADARWDDVVRVVPPPAEVKKKRLELDDNKAQQGLGEVYESEYIQQATGFTAPDKAEPLRRQAVALFKALCGKLDALSSFAFTPKPVVEELEVRSDVAALAVEEVAPLAVSDAAMRTPGEVYTAQAHGEQKAEDELTQEERKRRHAKKKRAHKNKEAAKAAEAAARAAASGDSTALAGRKSLAAQLAAATSSGLIKKGMPAGGGKSDYGKSSAVFGKLAEQAAAGKEGKKGVKGGREDKQQMKGAMLKL